VKHSLPLTLAGAARRTLFVWACGALGVASSSRAEAAEPTNADVAASADGSSPVTDRAEEDAGAPAPSATTAPAPTATTAPAATSAPPVTEAPPAAKPNPQGPEPGAGRLPPERPAGAYHFEPDVFCPFCRITPGYPHGRSGLHWHDHWRAVGLREYVTIPVLAGGFLGVQLFTKQPSHAHWKSPILFDRPVRKALRLGSAKGRRTAATISDAIFVWEVAHPTLVDPLLVAWWQRESPLVAWQMFVIDAQAYALTLLVTETVKRSTARQRPWVTTEDCATNPGGRGCGSGGAYQSFFSGHSAITATGAGLICAHHTQLSLYQNAFLDTGTCLLAVAGTAATGAMRIASDNHWVSDVLVGHLTGYVSGYLLPTLLYYKEFRAEPHDHAPPPAPVFATLPMITRDSFGLNVLGMF
jgi:membrane-associated phospholipid phosphatase